MKWFVGVVILATVGVMLRRLLRLDTGTPTVRASLLALPPELQTLYTPLAQEIETHTAIVGISLNDAFGERQANRLGMARRMVRLALGEWDRLAELLAGLQTALSRFLPASPRIVPIRRVSVSNFRSRGARDGAGLYEFLDQIFFSSKSRYSLRLRLLFRISSLVRLEFKRACREVETSFEPSDQLWASLDYYSHDFDLAAKETLLAFRALLLSLPPEAASALADEVRQAFERGVRVSVSASVAR